TLRQVDLIQLSIERQTSSTFRDNITQSPLSLPPTACPRAHIPLSCNQVAMGIRRLVSHLRQAGLGTTKELGRTGESPHGTKAIIDGPSFAYYIFNILEARAASPDTLDPTTTYDECAREAIRWLEKLEAFGFTIEAIYFDGALPLTKRSTREARMTAYVNSIHSLHDTYQQSIQRLRSSGTKTSGNAWDDLALRQAKKRAPPPAFLVPAVLEALRESEYRDRTFVMPDEADKFCILTARLQCQQDPSSRISIFSNDSDLLVFDSGPQTKIIPFSELRFSTDQPAVMSGLEIWPARFAASLGSESLLELAFWMSQHPAMSASDAQRKVESEDLGEDYSFQAFRSEYELGEGHVKALEARSEQRELYCGLDPRVSELVLQATRHAGLVDHKSLRVYGPVLLEDPSQRSAWNVGTSLRELAYTVLRQAAGVPNGKVLVEYWRAGDHVKMHECSLLDQTDVARHGAHYSDKLGKRRLQHTELTDVESWRFLIMRMALDDIRREGCPLPSAESVMRVLAGQKSSDWGQVHLDAQYQAMYYSLRMASQILRYIHLTRENSKGNDGALTDDALQMIRRELEHLPTISDFFLPTAETLARCQVRLGPLVEAQMDELDAGRRSRVEKLRKGKKRTHHAQESKGMRKKAMPSVGGVDADDENSTKLSSNPFAALGEE
ncbi:XPG domain containing, partial [Teratosphaeria destructans]